MTEKKYNQIVNNVIEKINDGVVLMTEKEELAYKKRVVNDLQYWVKQFPFMHLV